MDYQLEQRLHFDLIASLWRECEHREFVPKPELHEKLVSPEFATADEVIRELANDGIDLELDAFAKTGPDFDAWKKLVNEFTEPEGFYWRYGVTRYGVEGYVRREHLDNVEREEIAKQLQREGERAMHEADQVELQLELLRPYFVAPQVTIAEAIAALKARLESGDKAERARYESIMLRGLKQRFLQ